MPKNTKLIIFIASSISVNEILTEIIDIFSEEKNISFYA